MIRQEILQGLRTAMSKKESLQSAMQSFYNAGYKREDIEEAARQLQMEMFQEQSNLQQTDQKPKEVTEKKPVTFKPLETKPKTQEKPKPIQKISDYDREDKDTITIILIIILIVLLGALVAVFIFKKSIVEFLNNLF